MLLHQILAYATNGKKLKSHTKTTNWKCLRQRGIKNGSSKKYIIKKHKKLTENPPIRTYGTKYSRVHQVKFMKDSL